MRNEQLDIAFLQLSDIVTRNENTLMMQARNDGEEILKDVRLSFVDSALRLKDHSEFKFGDLRPGETATASVSVFADLGPGVNLVDSLVTWIERDVQNEEH